MTWRPQDSILPPGWGLVPGLLEAGRIARERPEPFAPILAWQSASGEAGFTLVKNYLGGLPEAVDEVLGALEELYGPPSWFSVTVDAYGRVAGPSSSLEPDDLRDLFAAGDWEVVEQLMVLIAAQGSVSVWRQVYRHTPADGWEWDSAEYMLNPVLPVGLPEVMLGHSR